MTTEFRYEVEHKFRGKGKVAEAEDWIRANVNGQWGLDFIGMQEEVDEAINVKTFLFHVRFKFGRAEECRRFREEFILGKKPVRAAAKPVPAKKGFFARLFS
ncbi:MAG: hypothetical protein P4M00_05220 [Azospirillaceae bacterium]|nr:hypothetical protein [Azospirillaceae bacterium]